MIQKGLKVHWSEATEYVPLDVRNLSERTIIPLTLERWRGSGSPVRYNTDSSVIAGGDEDYIIQLFYKPEKNRHLENKDVCWGCSTIRIKVSKTEGEAVWCDDDDKDQDGKTYVEIIARQLKTKNKRVSSSTLSRKQQQLKNALLEIDKQCVVTGERQAEVLEAAHIISAKRGGGEFIENGVLLRSDIHRLFDAKLLKFSDDGSLILEASVKQSYKKLLKRKRLNRAVVSRIRDALAMCSDA